LTIANEHFVEQVRPGCGNANHDNEGHVARTGNRLTLTTTTTTPGWPLEERGFVLVTWGEWLYLVEENSAMAFGNAVNVGSEPAGKVMIGTRSFYRREGDDSRAPPNNDSLPDVPPEWNKFIVRTRLLATIQSFQGEDDAAVIDLGTNDGVFAGLEFIVKDVPVDPTLFGSDRVDRVARVTLAEPKRSHLEYRNYKQSIPAGLTVETGLRFKPASPR
jgi:hypothetical protein